MRADIEQYLQDGYYAQGVALLRQANCVTLVQLRQFEQYLGRNFVPTDVENRLRAALRSHLYTLPVGSPQLAVGSSQSAVDSPQVADPPPSTVHRPPSTVLPFWSDLLLRFPDPPEEVLQLREKSIALHKEQAHIHPLMAQAARSGDRKTARELARQRIEGQKELDTIYDAAREWMATGKLPPPPLRNDAAADVMELMKRRKYCTERLCRLRQWLEKGQRPKTVAGERVVVLLSAVELQALDSERLERELELKGINETLGL